MSGKPRAAGADGVRRLAAYRAQSKELRRRHGAAAFDPPYSKDELGDALGTTSCALAAITDVRLAQAFVKTLDAPEQYAALLQDLEIRVQRVEKRRAEEKAHRRNVRFGKK